MAMHSRGVALQARAQGGVIRALKRSVLGGESFFVTTFEAPEDRPGWVDVAATLPGDIHVADLDPSRGLVVTRGAWLANADTVQLDTKWGGALSLFGGEGLFVAHARGQGPIVLACYGGLDVHPLGDGDSFTVDSGHVVAYDDTVQAGTRGAAGGLGSTIKSGEGRVIDFCGPGNVYTQTRNPSALVDWLTMMLPFTRS
jgi:uncharacterized protein (TIGR00266 family)